MHVIRSQKILELRYVTLECTMVWAGLQIEYTINTDRTNVNNTDLSYTKEKKRKKRNENVSSNYKQDIKVK